MTLHLKLEEEDDMVNTLIPISSSLLCCWHLGTYIATAVETCLWLRKCSFCKGLAYFFFVLDCGADLTKQFL